ncbi:MAG: EAL domain-containing protein [Ferrimonas sp.]
MSLFRQLLVLFIGSLLLLSGIMASTQIHAQRTFIAQQQQAQLFTSLNAMVFSAKPLIMLEDISGLDATLQAYFDAGQFSSLEIRKPDGQLIWQRQQSPQPRQFPQWLLRLGLFETLLAEQQLELQWRPLAQFTLMSDPSTAYHNLWLWIQQSFIGLIATMAIGLALLSWQLRRLTAPLKAICAQSHAISQHRPIRSISSTKMASTYEFAQVQQAFAVVAQHFNKLFAEQAQETQRLKQDLYTDPLSGIGNRELIESQIDAWCQQQQPGALVLMDIPALDPYCAEPRQYHLTVQQLKQHIEQLIPEYTKLTIARLNNTEFILLIIDINEDELSIVGRQLQTLLNDINIDPLGVTPPSATIAMLFSQHPSQRSELLAQVDKLHLQIQQHPSGQPLIQHQQRHPALGRKHWVKTINQAIAHEQLHFIPKPCISLNGDLQHFELFCQLRQDQQWLAANAFLPALESLQQTCAFDRYAVEQAIDMINHQQYRPLALNLCTASIRDSAYLRWLKRTMHAYPELADQLIFEISEDALYRHRDHAILAIELIDQCGFNFGIDHFGRYLTNITYLAELPPPKYVKLDTLYSQELDSEHRRSLLISLCRTAHNFNILTFATNIEDSEQLARFSELHVDGVQGNVSETWQEVQNL